MVMNDLKIYTEIGIGNPTLINTEIEYPDGTEIRRPGFQKNENQRFISQSMAR